MQGCFSPIPRARDDGLMTQDLTPDSEAAIAAGEAWPPAGATQKAFGFPKGRSINQNDYRLDSRSRGDMSFCKNRRISFLVMINTRSNPLNFTE